eukprot:12902794-Alexandrium_andersonii.AAC.1
MPQSSPSTTWRLAQERSGRPMGPAWPPSAAHRAPSSHDLARSRSCRQLPGSLAGCPSAP